MSVTYKEDGKPVFSDDHEYTTVIWAMSDGAEVPFSDFFDEEVLYGIKLDKLGYTRLQALAAIYIRPHLRHVYLEKIERTLYWGNSALDTAETLARSLDISITLMHRELAPDHMQWASLLKEHGPEAFETMASLRENFPMLLAEDGKRVGNILLQRGADFQNAKRHGVCRRGNGRYDLGSGTLFTVIGPILSAAIAHLTGSWPERDLKPGDGFRLTFVGEKLVKVEPQWIDLDLNLDGIWL